MPTAPKVTSYDVIFEYLWGKIIMVLFTSNTTSIF